MTNYTTTNSTTWMTINPFLVGMLSVSELSFLQDSEVEDRCQQVTTNTTTTTGNKDSQLVNRCQQPGYAAEPQVPCPVSAARKEKRMGGWMSVNPFQGLKGGVPKKRNHNGDMIEGGAECDICGSVLKHLSTYRRHLKTVHGELDTETIQSMIEKVKGDMGESGQRFEERRPCEVETCHGTFSLIENYKVHMKEVHGVADPDMAVTRKSDR